MLSGQVEAGALQGGGKVGLVFANGDIHRGFRTDLQKRITQKSVRGVFVARMDEQFHELTALAEYDLEPANDRRAKLPDVLLARASKAGLPAFAAWVQRTPLLEGHSLRGTHRSRHRRRVELEQRLLICTQARSRLEQIGAFDFGSWRKYIQLARGEPFECGSSSHVEGSAACRRLEEHAPRGVRAGT